VVGAGFRTRDDLAAFTTARSAYSSTYLDFASLAVPVTLWDKPVTFQVAWRRLYSLDYREIVTIIRDPLASDGPPPVRLDGNGDTIGSVDLASAAVAVRLTSRLSLGASFNLWRGDWTEAQVVSETPLEPPGVPSFGSSSQLNSLRGESLTLGLMLAYPRFSLGVLYQGPLGSDYSTSLSVRASDVPGVTTTSVDGAVRFPRAIGLGGAFRPAQRWSVALDLTWDDWTDALFDTPLTGRVNLFDELPPERSSTRDTLSLNAGDGFGRPAPLRRRLGAAGRARSLHAGSRRLRPARARNRLQHQQPEVRRRLPVPLGGLHDRGEPRARRVHVTAAAERRGRAHDPPVASQAVPDPAHHRHRQTQARRAQGLRLGRGRLACGRR